MLGRAVDEVPIVDVLRVREIRAVDRFPLGVRAAPVVLDEEQEREETLLVPFRTKKREHMLNRQGAEPSYEGAQLRYANPEEAIALTVLSLAGLEESLEMLRFARIGEGV